MTFRKRTMFRVGIIILVMMIVSILIYVMTDNEDGLRVKPYKKNVTEDHYDVIVIGGEPEGVAAAVSAARNGSEVLMLEERDALGGLFTFGELNYLDIPADQNGEVTSAGIFEEWWGLVDNVSTFDIDKAKKAFLYLIQQEENITLSLTTEITKVGVTEEEIQYLDTEDENGKRTFTAERYIDATADGEIAAMAGVPFTTGQEDIGKKDSLMAATMMIHLKNVDWEGVKAASNSGSFKNSEATDQAAWGFGEIDARYQEKQEGVNLRGLNIGRSPNGEVYINALQIFGVDGIDEQAKQEALKKGKKETKHILSYLNETFPGFEDAKIASYPEELYIRETRHMNTLYRVTASDLWENQLPADSIALGGYPVDIQSVSPDEKGYIVFSPNYYGIPFRSLVPVNLTNLLVTSKASGYDSIPAGSIRVVPTGMSVAEAGGVAADISIEEEVNFHQLSKSDQLIENVQTTLKSQGARLAEDKNLPYPYQGDEDYTAFREVYSLGLVSAGYKNELPLEKNVTVGGFRNLLLNTVKQVYYQDKDTRNEMLEKINVWQQKYNFDEHLTSDHMIDLLKLFPEIDQLDTDWIYTFKGDFTYREGYKALSLWIPSEEEER
ncbi:FAD-dependent oxidoreductase [Paraliobacillus salinarum]|uniref:FAD-dependent oxidoreductase n=1 Tax=Paraliobacillus salinarum TaxID=1158996 RepID=UPI0015F76A5C|nr:FAD-dependent oxidoreductase [Paraliobacillus salinarum]